jgi:hypothetical protein
MSETNITMLRLQDSYSADETNQPEAAYGRNQAEKVKGRTEGRVRWRAVHSVHPSLGEQPSWLLPAEAHAACVLLRTAFCCDLVKQPERLLHEWFFERPGNADRRSQ